MGFSKKTQLVESSLESEAKKWVIAGISVRSLKPINTTTKLSNKENDDVFLEEDEEEATTPTAKEARIPQHLPCPPAPMKRRPSRSNKDLLVREFFKTPDLETVFKKHVEKKKNNS